MTDRAAKAAFMISFIGHCLFLGVPGIGTGPAQSDKLKDITLRLEIDKPDLLPDIDVTGEEKRLKEAVERSKPPEDEPEPRPKSEDVLIEERVKKPAEEDIEVTDPAREAMLRYQDMVKQRIERTRRYPPWAKRQGIEGTVRISFRVLSDGTGRDIKVIRSAGYVIFDKEAIATIKRAGPFPPVPGEINRSSVSMEITIVFAMR